MDTENDYPYIGRQEADSASQIIQIDSGKHIAVVALCAALCGIAAVFAGWAAYSSAKTEKELRLVQYYLMDPHSRTPDELAAWVKFNREHEVK